MLGIVEQVAHGGEDGPPAPNDLLALLGQFDARFPPLDQADLELILKLLICMLSAGWVTAQASAAWPKCSDSASASR